MRLRSELVVHSDVTWAGTRTVMSYPISVRMPKAPCEPACSGLKCNAHFGRFPTLAFPILKKSGYVHTAAPTQSPWPAPPGRLHVLSPLVADALTVIAKLMLL